MPFTISQATCLNTVANFLLEEPDKHPGYERPTSEEAMKSLMMLVEHAHKALGAGLHAERVRELWAAQQPTVIALGSKDIAPDICVCSHHRNDHSLGTAYCRQHRCRCSAFRRAAAKKVKS